MKIATSLAFGSAVAYSLQRWGRDKPRAFERQRIGYPPLDTLKGVAEDVWLVDSGPIRPAGLSVPIRMTVLGLARGDLLLHSPTQLTRGLRAQIEQIGSVRHLVAPTTGHWVFLADWQKAFPEATVWAVPGLRNRPQVRSSDLRIDRDLEKEAPAIWASEVEQGLIRGRAGFVEAYFFHQASRTLVLADLIQNLETAKLPRFTGLFAKLAHSTRGKTPAHVRAALLGGEGTRRQVRHIVSLDPQRVIFAHGSWFEETAGERLRQAFEWLN